MASVKVRSAIPKRAEHQVAFSAGSHAASPSSTATAILSILNDFLEDDTVGLLGRWIKHVGFDLRSIRYPADLPAAWVAHYRQGRGYDYERALNDFVTWPPIARLIAMPAENECYPKCEKEHPKAASE